MSLIHTPTADLLADVTRLRHVELGTEMVYTRPGDDGSFVYARDVGGSDEYAVHLNDVEVDL